MSELNHCYQHTFYCDPVSRSFYRPALFEQIPFPQRTIMLMCVFHILSQFRQRTMCQHPDLTRLYLIDLILKMLSYFTIVGHRKLSGLYPIGVSSSWRQCNASKKLWDSLPILPSKEGLNIIYRAGGRLKFTSIASAPVVNLNDMLADVRPLFESWMYWRV